MTKEEWQKHLDDLFPNGLRVTRIEDVVEDMRDSRSFLTLELEVLEAEGDEVDILCFPISFELDIRFHMVKFEQYGKGWLVHTPDEGELAGATYFLSTNFSEETGQILNKERVQRRAEIAAAKKVQG